MARRALELNERLPAAHVALAIAQLMGDWDWAAAERSLLRALELNPSDSWAHGIYGWQLAYRGRLADAIAQLEHAQQLSPLNTGSVMDANLGRLYEIAGDRDKAVRFWDRILELDPDNRATYRNRGISQCQRGEHEQGIELLERAAALGPTDPIVSADLAHCYAVAGRRDAALEIVQKLEEYAQQTYISPMTIALIRTGLGEKDVALDWLERAYEVRAVRTPSIATDARFQSLRSDPRFHDLLRRMGLADGSTARQET